MPRKDPMTGVSVITQAEFWQSEAKREGREAYELMDDFYQEIADEDRRMEEEALANSDDALNLVKKCLDGFEDDEECRAEYGFCSKDIVSIEMIDAKFNTGIRESNSGFTAKLTLVDGTTRTVEYREWQSSGSYYEPPDYDENLCVIAVDDVPVVYKYESDCAHAYKWENEAATRIPKCEVCERFGGGALNGMINSAHYLCPFSTNQGKTVDRWVRVCVAHVHGWYESAGWLGPVIELKQKAPKLPRVHSFL